MKRKKGGKKPEAGDAGGEPSVSKEEQQQQQPEPQQQQKWQQKQKKKDQQPQQQQQAKPEGESKKGKKKQAREEREIGDTGFQAEQYESSSRPQQVPPQQAWRQQPPQQAAQPPPQQAWRQQPPQQAAPPPPQQAWRQQPPQQAAQPPPQQAWRQQPPQQAAQPPLQQAWRQQPPQQAAEAPPQQAWRQQPPSQQQPFSEQREPTPFRDQPGGRGAPSRDQSGRGAPSRDQKGRGRGLGPPAGLGTSYQLPGQRAPQELQPPVTSPPPGMAPPGFQAPRETPSIQQPVAHQPTDRSQAPSDRRPSPQPRQSPPSKTEKETSPTTSREKGDAASVESITSGISYLSLVPKRKDGKRPVKEGHGRWIKVDTNHLLLSMKDTKAIVYHYDVAVTPERPFKFYRPALKQVQEKYYPNQSPAFDGKKNIYSFKELPFPRQVLHAKVEVWDSERERLREMEVQIKFANTVDFSTIRDYLRGGTSLAPPQEAIQALDIVLRSPASNSFVPVGRSYFSPPPGQLIQLGGGLDLWYGFYQSAIIGWRPFLNIDVAHKGFPTAKNCIDILIDLVSSCRSQLRKDSEPDRRAVNDFKSFIKNLRIAYEIQKGGVKQKRTYKVLDLSLCPRNNRFKTESGMVTVEQYFLREYNYRIEYPLVPCIECGSKDKPISLPMELCRVLEGQVVNKKLNELQTRNMVRAAAVGTDVRRRRIEHSIREVSFNNDPCIKEFGISVDPRFTNVDARILDPPKLLYQQGIGKVEKGVWKSGRFLKANPLTNWAILNTERKVGMSSLQNLAESLQRNGKELGMEIALPTVVNVERPHEIEKQMRAWKQKGIELAVIIIPERGITYAKVKQIAEQQIGILTQCLKVRTLDKLSPSTVTNILLKINSKHNGINHNITCSVWEKYFSRPIIVFGADVTHPSPGQDGVPSVAAVAASYEPKAFSYNMEWRFQPPREEMITDLEEIVKKQLKDFYNHNNGLKPEKIFFYRDGVSEGQFKKVLDIELQAIRRACKGLGADYKPPITFLVVQKRHHTRFFPQPKDADGKNKNVPAGTVVDTTITHVNEIDFYLVSHASIQGTSRPTKYHVLWDDSYMSEDDIEELTYYLCHLFTRCTRAVSYPAPTYYAHLAAFRIRSYFEDQEINLNNLKREEDMKKTNPNQQFVKNSPMFFI